MMRIETFPVASIYVPVKRRATREQARVDALAAAIEAEGQTTPIQVRADAERDRFVLIEGLHRLEAFKQLGRDTIQGYRVDARKH